MWFKMVIKWRDGNVSQYIRQWEGIMEKVYDIHMTAMSESVSSLTIEPYTENQEVKNVSV